MDPNHLMRDLPQAEIVDVRRVGCSVEVMFAVPREALRGPIIPLGPVLPPGPPITQRVFDPSSIQNASLAASADRRQGHAAVAHGDRIVVVGGNDTGVLADGDDDDIDVIRSSFYPKDEVLVYESGSMVWSRVKTEGDFPTGVGVGVLAYQLVRGDRLFVFLYDEEEDGDDHGGDDVAIYVLDLAKLVWSKVFNPRGKARPNQLFFPASWVHHDGNSIVIFGGKQRQRYDLPCNDTLIFNTLTSTWTWQVCKGQIPKPRLMHASFVVGKKAYVYGGQLGAGGDDGEEEKMLLHRLDMETWVWTTIKVSSSPSSAVPKRMLGPTMTLLEDVSTKTVSRVLVFGKSRGEKSCQAWILQLEHGNGDGGDAAALSPSARWIRCKHLDGKDCHNDRRSGNHQAVVERKTGQVWLVGGMHYAPKRRIGRLTVTRPLSLELISMEVLRRSYKIGVIPKHMPKDLLDKFHAYVQSRGEVMCYLPGV